MCGNEWIIEAFGCSRSVLTSQAELMRFFQAVIEAMSLHPVGDAVWHQFPETQGLTGLLLLRESHLTIHTFPEFQSACINLFCCSARPLPDWQGLLSQGLGAQEVSVREFPRNYVCH